MLRFLVPVAFGHSPPAVARLQLFLDRQLSGAGAVQVQVASSYGALQEAVLSGEAELAWVPPLVAARLELHGLRLAVRAVRDGSSSYRAALLHRRDRPVDPAALQGVRAAWVDRESAAGWLLPRSWLRRCGVDPDRALVEQRFLGSYRAAVDELLAGRADLCAVSVAAAGSSPLESAAASLGLSEAEAGQLSVLALTEEVPNDGIVVGPFADAETFAALQRRLLAAVDDPEGRLVLKEVLRADSLEPAPAESYRALGEIVLASLGLSAPSIRCASCSAQLSPRARFCDQCGSPVGARPAAGAGALPEPLRMETGAGERKLATVLFSDLANFTRISSHLEPDAVRDFANACFGPLAEEVERHGGTVVKYIGDCIMAVFGVPVGREDDARRAVEAALSMKARLAGISSAIEARFGAPVSMRVGLNTGEVMVGWVGGGHRSALDVMGSVVNTASRIEGVARPGEVLLGASTYRQVREHFACEAIGPISLKGLGEPVLLHRVEGAREEGAESDGTELRAPELSRLQEAFAAAVQRQAPLAVLLLGEVGSGKHRLLSLLSAHLAGHPSRPLVLRSASVGGSRTDAAPDAPLRVLGVLLRRHFALPPLSASGGPAPELAGARARLLSEISRAFSEDEREEGQRVASLLAEVTGLAHADPVTELPPAEPDSGSLVAGALAAWLRRVARQRPVCLLLEDLERADPASRALLAALPALLGDAPVFFVLAGSRELAESPGMAGLPHERVELDALTPQAAEAFAARLLEKVEQLPPGFAAELARRGEGRPGGIRELVELLRDQGRILPAEAGRPSTFVAGGPGLGLPDSLRGLHQARLDALPADEKELLRLASAIGRVFWQAAAQFAAAELLPERVARLLASLQQRGLLVARRPSSFPGEIELAFRTEGLRDAAYESLPRATRETAHRRVASWLGLRAELGDAVDAEIAAHLGSAGEEAGAREHLLRAGRRALRLFAPEEAAAFFSGALEGWPDADPAGRSRARREQAQALALTGRHAEALGIVELASADLAAAGGGAEPAVSVELVRAQILKEQGRTQEALAALERGLHQARALPPTAVGLLLLGQRAFLRAASGDSAGATADCEAGLALAAGLPAEDERVRHGLAVLQNSLGGQQLFARQLPEAEASFRRALALAGGAPSPRARVVALVNLGAIAFDRGEHRLAVERFGLALTTARGTGWAKSIAVCLSNLGQAHLALGELSAAVAALDEARRRAAAAGLADVLADSARALSEARLLSGAPEQALVEALEALQHAERSAGGAFRAGAHAAAMRSLLEGATPPGGGESLTAARVHLEAAVALLKASPRPGGEAEIAALQDRFARGLKERLP